MRFLKLKVISISSILLIGMIAACGSEPSEEATATPAPTVEPTVEDLPEITAVSPDKTDLPIYDYIEMQISLDANYDNHFDARQVSLDGLFTAPDGTQTPIYGFWDDNDGWLMRFTPSQEGEWQYALTVQDERGTSSAVDGTFTVTPSDNKGWLLPGNQVNSEYSGHYLVHHDGTPFYGIGYCEALNILIDGFNAEDGVRLFDNMHDSNSNFVVWWPLYTNSPVSRSYESYSQSNLDLIDLVVEDAAAEDIYLIFTIWDHPELRDDTHNWDTGRWENNGFKTLGSLESFFVSDESWVWQENFYRYIIARWGHSPSIGMWQTVSEIDGTNAYDQTDPWHNRVNAYFVDNDPYRHPTTASMAGDVDWEEGHLNMDAPQVHVYALEEGAIKSAEVIAGWTQIMWDRAEKPNWVGEFGVGGDSEYPELFHHSIWAALGSGAAMTPAEWNSGGFWGRMTPEMNADLLRLSEFMSDLPMAELNPSALTLTFNSDVVRGWGVSGTDGGLFWVQDFSMEGDPIADLRQADLTHDDVVVEIEGLSAGTYTILPFDTWQGVYLDGIEVSCEDGTPCAVALPEFTSDMAFKIGR